MRFPDFMIIGAQKSATTFVRDCLSEHPGVYMPPGECSIFEEKDYSEKKLAEFSSMFDHVEKNILAGIKRPSYLGTPEVPQRVKDAIPDCKLIAVLRDPVDRAVSAYYHNMSGGFIPVCNIEKGMRKILNGDYEKKYKRASEIIDFGFYARHLKRYLEYFEKKKILLIFHEDIKNNGEAELKKILRFLGLDDSFKPASAERRPQAVSYNLLKARLNSMKNIFKLRYNADRTRCYAKEKRTPLDKIALKVLDTAENILRPLLSGRKPELSAELKKILLDTYKQDIDELEKISGRNLKTWNR